MIEFSAVSDKKRDIMILQSWFSPAFPIGAFSYSHGLETAIQDGLITDEVSLQSWISTLLSYGSGRNDGIFIKETYKGEEGTNALCLALCTSKERWQETVELGQAFGRVVNSSYQTDLPDMLAYPVAVGLAARAMELDLTLTLQSYLQAFAANLISVGVRAIPIGQQAGQHCLVRLYPVIEEVISQVAKASLDQVGSAALLSDIIAIKHEHSIPRIYRT
tara:strand:- start:576 stop:1232 length:657 start_codon:yes stop_codon:yes gene_type:complete